MITIENCPACGASNFKELFSAPFFRGDQERFRIQECEECKLWFTSPRPADDELAGYYDTGNYISHTNQKKGVIDNLYHWVREYSVRKKVSLINSLNTDGKKLLDYGAGTGHFLQAAKSNGWKSSGVEPSVSAREVALAENDIKLYSPDEFEWSEKYNVITLWHVLEHLPNLNDHLDKFSKALLPHGCLLIAVPNHESYDSKYYGADWAALDVPLHLYHFKKRNLKFLAEKHGLVYESVHNMPFDSFYVSMLSEKIRTGKSNLPKAFFKGLQSNMKGIPQKNASSLIHILRKP